MSAPKSKEQFSSHIPALVTLMNLGWEFISQADCQNLRGGTREVLLPEKLTDFLKTRSFEYKGESHSLSDAAIEQILKKLRTPGLQDGLLNANQKIYEHLTLGITVTEFMPDGKRHQPTIAIIDWQDTTTTSSMLPKSFLY